MDEDDFLILIRPSDLATLRIATVNLEMDGTKIRRSTPGDTAAVIIVLPPQHFREHPQFAADDVLDLAAAAPTGLAFSLPDGADEIELGGQSLLGLCEQLELAGRSTIAVPARATLMPLEATWRLSATAVRAAPEWIISVRPVPGRPAASPLHRTGGVIPLTVPWTGS